MKKQRWAVFFAALLAVVGFSSCLNSEDDGVRTITDYVEVSTSGFGGVSFNSMYGWVCVPNKTLTSTPESNLAYVVYQYNNSDLQAISGTTSTSTDLPVTLLQDPVYLKNLGNPSSTLPEVTKTVSLYSLGSGDGMVWRNNKYLILAPAYMLKEGTNQDNVKTELANHHLSVYYVSDDDNVSSNTLTLKLRYQIDGIGSSDSESTETSESWANDYTVKYTDLVYVRLDYLISQYKAVHGSNPKSVAVEYEYNNNSANLPTIANKKPRTVTFSLYETTSNQ